MVPPKVGGRVGILTAGTSDLPAAEEAAMLCREMGCEVYTGFDMGVAGLHRLFDPLREMLQEHQVDVLIVAAGMDGAGFSTPGSTNFISISAGWALRSP